MGSPGSLLRADPRHVRSQPRRCFGLCDTHGLDPRIAIQRAHVHVILTRNGLLLAFVERFDEVVILPAPLPTLEGLAY
jgi:hypothetical protein